MTLAYVFHAMAATERTCRRRIAREARERVQQTQSLWADLDRELEARGAATEGVLNHGHLSPDVQQTLETLNAEWRRRAAVAQSLAAAGGDNAPEPRSDPALAPAT